MPWSLLGQASAGKEVEAREAVAWQAPVGPSDDGIRGSMDPSAPDERKTPVRGAQARIVPVSDEQSAGGAGAGAVTGETRLEVPTGGYAWGGRRPDGTVYVRFDKNDEWLFPKDESSSPEAGARDDSVQSDGEDDVTLDPDSKVGKLVSALRAVARDQDQARERAIADWYAGFKRSMSERAEKMQDHARMSGLAEGYMVADSGALVGSESEQCPQEPEDLAPWLDHDEMQKYTASLMSGLG